MHAIHLTPAIEAVLAQDPLILVNYSGGKDSETALHQVHVHFGATHRIEIVYADTGFEYDAEQGKWVSTEQWIRDRAAWYGYPLHIVRHPTTTYLDRVVTRGRFPSQGARWCTSDFKRSQIAKFIRSRPEPAIISVLGLRAAESDFRAGLPPWSLDTELTANRSKLTKQPRTVYEWLPIHSWPTPYIFDYCRKHNLPLHPVYDWLPSKRFSCQVCIFATDADLAAICRHNPRAFRRIAALEQQINFTMKSKGAVTELADRWEAKQRAGIAVPEGKHHQLCLF